MEEFIQYLSDIINDKKIILLKDNKIIIEEKNENTKLKKIKIEFNKKRFEVLHISLDENNFENDREKIGIYTIFKKEICSSVDGILFVYDKRYERHYIFHIELKSSTKNPGNILKKQITSVETMNFILSQIYLKFVIDFESIKFPEKIYCATIVFYRKKNGLKTEIIKRNYGIQKFKGNFSKKYYYYTQAILTEKSKNIDKIKLESLCNLNEYSEQEIMLREVIK